MFDFTNYTYSGLLSIIVALLSFAYPKIVDSISCVDAKYGSSMLTARLQREKSFYAFRVLLVINLFCSILLPFLLDQSQCARWYIMFQAVIVVSLIAVTFCLFHTIGIYNNPGKLQNEIWSDFKTAQKKRHKENERQFFSQWVDLACYTMSGVDGTTAKNVYDCWSDYLASFVNDKGVNNFEYDGYFYEGLAKLNDCLCKNPDEPISVNNRNPLLCSLIAPHCRITDSTYQSLRRNLILQVHYGKDEWIMNYWEQASQRYGYFMKKISTYFLNEEIGVNYTPEEVQERDEERWRYYEFHLMLCAVIMQMKKYELLRNMMSFTQSFPSSYPLIPSTIHDCLQVFHEFNQRYSKKPMELEKKYPMLRSHGIADGLIMGTGNMLLALMVLRVYTLIWPYGSTHALGIPYAANNLKDNASWVTDMETLKRCLSIVRTNSELLQAIGVVDLQKTFENAKDLYGEIKEPEAIIDEFVESVNQQIIDERQNVPYDVTRVDRMKDKVVDLVTQNLNKYPDFMTDRNFPDKDSYRINASVFNLFPNSAFADLRDMDYVNIPECMVDGMMFQFWHYFAYVFYREVPVHHISVDSEELFQAVDRLCIDNDYTIVSFGIYWDYYIDRIEGLCKDGEVYLYHGIKILDLSCWSSLLSQCLYVMKSADLPYLIFQEPLDEWKEIYQPECKNTDYQLWLSLQKIKDKPNIINENDRERMTDNPDEMSVFAGILLAEMYWKKKCPTVKITIKYKLVDNGNVDSIDKIYSFVSYEKKANQYKAKKITLSQLEWKVMQELEKNPQLSASRLGSILMVNSRVINKSLVTLRNNGLLERNGSPKNGSWNVVMDWESKCQIV